MSCGWYAFHGPECQAPEHKNNHACQAQAFSGAPVKHASCRLVFALLAQAEQFEHFAFDMKFQLIAEFANHVA